MLRSRPLLLLGLLALALAAYRMWVVSRLGVDAFVDEAQYGDWGRSLAWGYYSKPPLIAALIAASSAVFGDGPLAIKLPAFVLYPATALLVCALGRHLFDARTGFLSGLVFLTLPLVSALGLFVSTDAPLLFFWAAGMWLLVLALERGGGWWLALGACVGLGLMSKYAMLFFVASTACAIAWRRDGTRGDAVRGSLIALAVALLCVAPNLWWNAEHGFPTFEHVAHTTRGADGGWNPLGVLEFVGVQWLAIGPLVGGLTLLALPGLRRRWEDPRLRLLVAFALPVLAVVAFQALSGRVNGNWAAPALIPLVLLTVAHFAQRPRLVMLAMACNVMLAVALYQWPDLVRASGYELSAGLDPYKRARLERAGRGHPPAARGASRCGAADG